jgi:putative addiction module component (TIGR02574 family)
MSKPELDIGGLSVEERLSLLEQLWDSLAVTPEAILPTKAQREELDRRLDDLDAEGSVGIPWEEVLDRIRSHGR